MRIERVALNKVSYGKYFIRLKARAGIGTSVQYWSLSPAGKRSERYVFRSACYKNMRFTIV